jgi:general nucleoside transport system ATP-binding protein
MLAMRGITKAFPGVVANDHVDFDVHQGEIHALVGENGAGKTTLMNILYGLYQPDAGEINLHGRPVAIESPRHAIALGIGMVHQHFMLIPTFTVADNLALGLRSSKGILLESEQVARRIERLSDQFGLHVDPRAPVWQLPVGVQQRVEILKALYRGADLLILDEPTAILTPQETDELFGVLRTLVKQGHSIIFISHKLKEVTDISDRITVLRRGRVAGTIAKAQATIPELARMMVGQDLALTIERTPGRFGPPLLRVEDLTVLDDRGLNALRGVSFEVRAGEILGLAGVEGNGQRELADGLTGLRPAAGGHVHLAGSDITNATPAAVFEAGMSYIPEDRNEVGTIGKFTLAENGILKSQERLPFARWGFLQRQTMHEHARQIVAEYDIRTPGIGVETRTLSGGNRQKLILGREVQRRTPVLIAVQPTRGLDLATTKFVQRKLLELREAGKAVLLISTELDEVLALSDRIAVLYGGQIMDILDGPAATRESIGLLMAGIRRDKDRVATSPQGQEAAGV